ncbi:MAG: hypothetical protein OXG87_11130 [Gemmatimonadetes bacterium]|nr:hypothetical protein [Gemmatimonadota bacterium]
MKLKNDIQPAEGEPDTEIISKLGTIFDKRFKLEVGLATLNERASCINGKADRVHRRLDRLERWP